MLKRVLLLIALLTPGLSLTKPARRSPTTYNPSCSWASIKSAIVGAADGDTIQLPGSCTVDATSAAEAPNVGLNILGAGSPTSNPATMGADASCTSTTINDKSTGEVFGITPLMSGHGVHISCMQILPDPMAVGQQTVPLIVLGTCTMAGCPNLRLDNMSTNNEWNVAGSSFLEVNNMFGVVDHNTIGYGTLGPANGTVLANLGHSAWQGVGDYGDNSWYAARTFGTEQSLTLENNKLRHAILSDSEGGGPRWVCRFNDVNGITKGGACTTHGTDTGGRLARGGVQNEDYGNTFECLGNYNGATWLSPCDSEWGGRAGGGYHFGNTYTNAADDTQMPSAGTGDFRAIAQLGAQRTWRLAGTWLGCPAIWDDHEASSFAGTIASVSGSVGNPTTFSVTVSGTPWTPSQFVDATGNPYSFSDDNSGIAFEITANEASTIHTTAIDTLPTAGDTFHIYQLHKCLDQSGVSGGNLIEGLTPVLHNTGMPGPVQQVLDPIYQFMDSLPMTSLGTIGGATGAQEIVANRNYYAGSVGQVAQTSASSPFNGTTGTGFGTSGLGGPDYRPTTCTLGVGYWATDRGSWNTSGNSFGQGELFTCTQASPAVWTLKYTPSRYPHSLDTNGSTTTLTFTGQPCNTVTGQVMCTVMVTDSGGGSSVVTLTISGCGASITSGNTATESGGLATFASILMGGTGSVCTFTASASGAFSAVSNPFNVTTPPSGGSSILLIRMH